MWPLLLSHIQPRLFLSGAVDRVTYTVGSGGPHPVPDSLGAWEMRCSDILNSWPSPAPWPVPGEVAVGGVIILFLLLNIVCG